jgi:Protein of unknown function (DUF4232)
MRSTIFSVKRLAAAAAAAAGLTIAGLVVAGPSLAQQSPASVTSSKAAPPCQSSGIDDWLDTNGGGAAGTIFYHVEFTNLSGHACTLQGFPFVFAVNLSGHQIGNRAVFNHAFPATMATVANGRTIHAVLGIVNTGNFATSACKPVTAAGLEVFAPTGINEVGRTVPFPFSACSTTGSHAPNFLNVTPVHSGA